MELKMLKRLRLLIPGILFLILILLFFIKDLYDVITSHLEFYNYFGKFENYIFIILIIFIGLLYYVFDIRYIIWKKHLELVRNNIKDKLLEPFRNNYSTDEINSLKKGRQLINIFYHFIDKDPSLKERAMSVRFNGFIWTSFIDLQIISFLGFIIFLIIFMIVKLNYYLYIAIALFFLSLISPVFINRLTKKHMLLGNKQLEMIHQSYKNELEQEINDLLS